MEESCTLGLWSETIPGASSHETSVDKSLGFRMAFFQEHCWHRNWYCSGCSGSFLTKKNVNNGSVVEAFALME